MNIVAFMHITIFITLFFFVCVVAATTTNAGDSKQYRERLGTLLDDGKGAEQKVDGVNNLWKALAILDY